MSKKFISFILVICFTLSIAGCIRPYKLDIEQGNKLTSDMVAKLKTGMSKEQVRFLLGTPLLKDSLHAQRWDYVYYLKPGYGEITRRHLSVEFQEGVVAKITGDTDPQFYS